MFPVVCTKYLIPADKGLNGLYMVSIGNNFWKATGYLFSIAADVAVIYSTIVFKLYSIVAPQDVETEYPFLSKSLVAVVTDIILAPKIYLHPNKFEALFL